MPSMFSLEALLGLESKPALAGTWSKYPGRAGPEAWGDLGKEEIPGWEAVGEWVACLEEEVPGCRETSNFGFPSH